MTVIERSVCAVLLSEQTRVYAADAAEQQTPRSCGGRRTRIMTSAAETNRAKFTESCSSDTDDECSENETETWRSKEPCPFGVISSQTLSRASEIHRQTTTGINASRLVPDALTAWESTLAPGVSRCEAWANERTTKDSGAALGKRTTRLGARPTNRRQARPATCGVR